MRREGSQLTLGGRPFRFAGATNYYMLSRAVDKTTRPQVLIHLSHGGRSPYLKISAVQDTR